MALDDKHPSYLERQPDWELLEDCYAGERRIKEQGTRYLPATSGMIANGFGQTVTSSKNVGQAMYEAYRLRAVFHDVVREAITGLLGVMHRRPPKVEVPAPLEPVVASMTMQGESLELLARRISEHQLKNGRLGLLVDVPDGKTIDEAVPYVALYAAQAVINWNVALRDRGREQLTLVVLDESGPEQQPDLSWQFTKQLRIACLGSVAAMLSSSDKAEAREDDAAPGLVAGDDEYTVAIARGDEAEAKLGLAEFVAPSLAQKKLDRVPFVFVNPNDLTPTPDIPPLLGLANLAVTIYRGEADYRQSLFMQGQDTLVREGATDEQKAMTGVGAIMDVPMGGKAYFIGVTSSGLAEQRTALENDKLQASHYAVQMLDAGGGKSAESGEALRIRVTAKTATLASLQKTAAQALVDVLRIIGEWMGLGEAELEKIKVEPNVDFADEAIDLPSLNALMDAVTKGLPLSRESIHAWLKQRDFTLLEFAEEVEKILAEATDLGPPGGAGTDTDIDPGADDDVPPGGDE